MVAPTLSQPSNTSSMPLAQTASRIADFIAAHTRLSEGRTVFPIDPFGQDTNPHGLAFGLTGVVHAFDSLDRELPKAAL